MFPAISKISTYYTPGFESEHARASKETASKPVSNPYAEFSTEYAKQRAARVFEDVTSFLNSTQTNTGDGVALRRLLRDRLVGPSSKYDGSAFQQTSTKYVEQRTAQILKGVDSFLTSQYTTLWDGVVLRRLLRDRFVSTLFTNRAPVVKQPKKHEALGRQYLRAPSAFIELTENYTRIVEGLFDFQVKKIATRLMIKGIISSGEFLKINCSGKDQSAMALLDTLTTSSVLRPSLDLAASKFKKVLRMVNHDLAREIYPNLRGASNL